MTNSKSEGKTRSYEAHKEHIDKLAPEIEKRLAPLKNNDCVAYQLINDILKNLSPFLQTQNNWLTIGDYAGYEANYLLKNGQKALASDLSDLFLQESQKEGFIEEYNIVNVENIHFPDNSFDYVSCKEAYHHFPRAFWGLYEMIRVANKAAILIEPIDVLTKIPSLLFVKNVLDKFNPTWINKVWKNRFSFEPVGNYVFKVSEREMEKIAMGIGLPNIAFKRMNVYLSHEQDPRLIEVPLNKSLWSKIQRKLNFRNILSYFGVIPHNTLICVIFKQAPTENIRQAMEKMGFQILDLPKNPYLKSNA